MYVKRFFSLFFWSIVRKVGCRRRREELVGECGGGEELRVFATVQFGNVYMLLHPTACIILRCGALHRPCVSLGLVLERAVYKSAARNMAHVAIPGVLGGWFSILWIFVRGERCWPGVIAWRKPSQSGCAFAGSL